MPLSGQGCNQIFVGALTVTGALGVAIGYVLSGYTHLETFKLLNIIGLFYDLLGIVVLSEIVSNRTVVKVFFVKWVSGSLIWAQTVIPLGALMGTGLGYSLPSSGVAAKFFGSFFAYSVLILGLIEATVFVPQRRSFQNLETRSHMFGLILLVTGVLIQIVAAFKDLNS